MTIVRSTPRGLDFIRRGIARAVSDVGQERDYAASRWGEKSRVARITRAAVAALNTQVGAGDQMVSDEGASAEFYDLVRARSIIGRLPLRRVPFFTRTLSMDEGPRVAWRGEGAAHSTSPLKLTNQIGLAPLEVGALIVTTKELLENDSVEAELIIRDQLTKALATAVDAAFIDPANSGSANVKPASVTSGVSSLNSPLEGIFEMGADTFTGDPDNAWIIMHPMQAARRQTANRPDLGARGGSWGGFPVITSSAVPEDIVVLLDPDQIALAMGNADIRTSDQASVELADSSSMASAPVSAANLTSLWQTDSKGIIGSLSANWRVVRAGSVQYFDAQSIF